MIISKSNIRSKQLLFSLETKCAAIVAEGIARFVPKFLVVHRLKTTAKDAFIVDQFTKMYDRMLKKVKSGQKMRKMSKNERLEAIYSTAEDEFNEIERVKNRIWREENQKKKINELMNDLKDEKNIFFVCSRHQNSASDHADYQGKLYYAEDWENRTDDVRVKQFINRKKRTKAGLLSVEEVCFDKPYLVTRPNCRHTLKPVRTSTVLSGEWVDEVDNVKDIKHNLTYEKYYERTKFLTELNKKLPNKKAARDIARSRALMKKHRLRAANS